MADALDADAGVQLGEVDGSVVAAECRFELVFEDDDAAGRFQGGALEAQLPGSGGAAELVAE